MTDTAPDGTQSVRVEWGRLSPDTIRAPLVRDVEYVELKLEHPDVEPTGLTDRSFPDAVPYEFEGTSRMFYWRPALQTPAESVADWALACATTHKLLGIPYLPETDISLSTPGANGKTVIVDGTVAGGGRTAQLESYTDPTISIVDWGDSAIEVDVDGTAWTVDRGERRRIPLEPRWVVRVGEDSDRQQITPELVIRYPGRRELHHPAIGEEYRLFPSFGFDLGSLSNPIRVPMAMGELDADSFAEYLGIHLSDRPYPERVLWQAFAYTAFDPHEVGKPELIQLDDGHIILRPRPAQ